MLYLMGMLMNLILIWNSLNDSAHPFVITNNTLIASITLFYYVLT